MESLPDALIQYILSHVNNAKDVVSCTAVSVRWKDSVPYLKSLFFPRNIFDNLKTFQTPDEIVCQIISSIVMLEELVVYCPFTSTGLSSWLSVAGPSLKNLELRMDNLNDQESCVDTPSKLDSIGAATSLESLKLWGVLMTQSPKWETFQELQNLEIVGARLEDPALSNALKACPNLTHLLLLGCEGLRSISVELLQLQHCKLDFYGGGNCSLSLISPKLEYLEIQGCCWIRVPETQCLKTLSISNNSGRVYLVDFGKLLSLESLSVRGIQWCWDAMSKILEMASEVKELYMKVEFTGDFDALLPFPEVDFVGFFNSHPKLEKLDIHGAMFASLCQKNSLKNVDQRFVIPNLEEVVITVRSPLNAEQKMGTLESIVKYGIKLKKMRIKILQMKSSHSSSDEFFDDVCRFRYMNRKIVSIE